MLRPNRCYSGLVKVSKWKVTVGLEIHAQLSTPHKLFSRAPNCFGSPVNTDLEPFDVALPGSQPRLNRHAILLAVKAALAFGCKVNPSSSFDRKHYFYPDQPAGYQITQNYNALAHDGSFSLFERDGIDQKEQITVGISQLQVEQDTARTTYFDNPPQSLVDLNRNGTPLIEIVTTPCIPTAKAAGAALRKIQSILRAVNASDANMEAGGMRCDVNVSVTTDLDRHLGPSRRVEIKNLASGRIVNEAVTAESARQISILEAGGTIIKETRGFDVEKKSTFTMRTKESAMDYRYMPEPDLSPVRISNLFLEKCLAGLPELPDAQLDRLLGSPYNLTLRDAKVLQEDLSRMKYYDSVLRIVGIKAESPKIVCNWIVHELLGRQRVMTESGKIVHTVSADQLGAIITRIMQGKMTGSAGKVLIQAVLDGAKNPIDEMIRARGFEVALDDTALRDIIRRLIEQNEQQARKLKSGDVKIKKWFVGQTMRETKGRAKPLEIEASLDTFL